MNRRWLTIAALAALSVSGLTGCEDKTTAMARCENDAYSALGDPEAQVEYVKNCMLTAGYKPDPECAGIAVHSPYCYTPAGLMAKIAAALRGRE
jgi:hypothetical protein